jgi:hypothetical protein
VSPLDPEDVACWVLKSSAPPTTLAPGWFPGAERVLTRCVRPSYRLDLMAAGQPCLLWLSGRVRPGVHALGELLGPPDVGPGGPEVPVRLTLLTDPVDRVDLLADPAASEAEVLRMPAGSNPSWLTRRQFAAVLARVPEREVPPGLGRWTP